MSAASTNPDKAEIDFFISYTGKDQPWAEWIAWQLEEAGYKTIIQAWDFKSGGVFPADMHRALQHSARVIAVLTPAYMESGFCQPEWQAAFAANPTGEKGILTLIRVADFKPDGLLLGRTYIDLVGKTADAATDYLLERLKPGRAKPSVAPPHPGTSNAPTFPGTTTTPTAPVLQTSIPHNLPTLQPFFGREDELKKIAEALDPDTRGWGALIDGPGGMGKTSLAVRAAYAASPDVFKKIIFVSLKTRELDDDGLRDLSGFLISGLVELLGELARELGRDDLLKLPEDQRPRPLLDALRGTQSLLVLDNLESLTKPERDTLFTFVKKLPTGCKAILTSRGRIGSGAEELILEALSQEAALATLAELATHNPLLAQTSEAERLVLYRETAGKPLLLRWTAGQLGRGHCLTFTDALHFIRSCPEGNDPLEFIFGDLVVELSDVETRALCALTYFSIPAKVEHIAAIAGLDIADAKECRSCVPSIRKDEMPRQKGERGACSKNDCDLVRISQSLATLANRSLVVPDQEERAFTLVPMVADFLRLRKPEIVAQTGDKIEKSAYASILENGSRQTERFPILQAEWPTISASLSLFLSGENERLQKICIALDLFLDFTGRWDELLSLCDRAESKALVARDFYHAGWRAYSAGIGHLRFQQGEEALVCASRAKTHWQIIQVGPRESSLLLDLLGNGYKLKKQYAEAIASFRESVCLRRSVSSQSVGLSMAINDLADAEACLGDHLSALTNYGEALNMAKAINYAEGTAAYTGNLARLALSLDDSDGAVTHASEALALSEKLGRIELIASSCECLAEALLRQGRAAEALPHARKAVEIFTRLGSPDLAGAQATLTECEAAA